MIRIITDSACDCRGAEIDRLGLTVIPMTIQFGDETYRDGVDLSADMFYDKLVESSALPTTSQITPYEFEEVFEEVTKAGDEAIVILMSSELSGTVQSARIAATDYDNIYVVDSYNATVGEKCLVDYARVLVDEGKSAKEIKEILDERKHDIKLLALLDTLEYLKKGGRISAATAFVGGMLSIKPVVTVANGKVEMVGKARGSKNGNNLLMEMVDKVGGIDFDMPINLGYTGMHDTMLKKYIEDSKVLWENQDPSMLKVTVVGSTVGTHVGPGAIAFAFFKKR